MPETLKNMKQILNDMIDERISNLKGLDIYVVTGVNEDDLTLNIKRMNMNMSVDRVEMIGTGLGHGKGIIKLPSENDVVMVAFVQDSEKPYVLGTIFHVFSSVKDSKIDVKKNELFLNAQLNGSYVHIDADNNILFKTPNGAKLKLLESGGFKLFNSGNYGIEVDASGNMTLRAVIQNSTTSAGTW